MAVGPRGVAAATASRLNATAHPADARPTRVRRDNLPLPRPTTSDVSTQAKWFPGRRCSEEIGIRIDTSVTSRCRAMRFGDAAMRGDELGSCEVNGSLRRATNRPRAAPFAYEKTSLAGEVRCDVALESDRKSGLQNAVLHEGK